MIDYIEELSVKLEGIENLLVFYKDKKEEMDKLWKGLDTIEDRFLREQSEQKISDCIQRLERSKDRLLTLKQEIENYDSK